jgi:hypothetical protein
MAISKACGQVALPDALIDAKVTDLGRTDGCALHHDPL